MTEVIRLNPDGLPPAVGCCQVTVAQGSHIVHVSGQAGIEADGGLVGPDHRSQIEQSMRNLQLALTAAGATIEDVVKSTFYVLDYSPDLLAALGEAAAEVFGAAAPDFAATLVGVTGLADPGYLVEIDATAVLP